jgi:transcription-repair coupling factor (superfamily II helicase)
MSLSGLLPLLYDQPGYGALARALATGEDVRSGAPLDTTRPYLLSALHADVTGQQGRPMIVVTPRPDRARQLYEGLLAYSPPNTPIYLFPAPDLLPYERIAPDPTIVGERLRVLASLGIGDQGSGVGDRKSESRELVPGPWSLVPPIIVTSVLALMQPAMAPDDLGYAVRTLKRGEQVDLRELLGHLVDLGYESVAMVDAPGQFSRRGGIVDIYAPTSTLPVRIEFFGDEVDSIRVFNPLTQRSERQAEGVIITPSCEMPLWRRESAAQKLREIDPGNLREEVREEWEAQLQKIEMGECFEGMELFAPYYAQPLTSLADYLALWTTNDRSNLSPQSSVLSPLLVLDDPDLIRLEAGEIERQAADLYKSFIDNGELPPGLLRPYLKWDEVAAHGRGLPVLSFGGEDTRGALEAPHFELPPLYAGKIDTAIEEIGDMIAQRARVIIVSQQSARLRELLEEADIYPTLRKGMVDGRRQTADGPNTQLVGVEQVALSAGGKGMVESLTAPPSMGSVHLLQGTLAAGWRLPQFEQSHVVLLTDAELFGRSSALRRQAQGAPARRANAADAAAILREKMLLELQPGDYVVHVEHGIAKYGGLVKMERDGIQREYMFLLYAENDRLYVPADQTDRVAPYIGAGPPPHLHRLGTQEWSRTKRKVRESAELLAKELLKLYAARETAPGHSYPQDTPWQIELEDSFPYVETPDQLRAIEEVKGDMEAPRPMDRLICGDVGYGKTEVALRAAFKAVMDGRQVGVLVPTTVLAQQHYNTFSERLAAFPVKVEMLSRFRSKKEQEQIIKDLGEGKIDIVVGTHMLLSKNVRFKDVGLVVIDEEQRFGVRHKERLKQLRAEVDVITLSATPIPRTLYMAVSGVRDLSLIETPPESRLPIKTYVTAFRPQLVREVILRELERGGQVFFVHNRVETIDKLMVELQSLVPEARFIVGHGQMPEDHLEKVMQRFVAGDADVLLCTTIIESGLDIPNANTLVVDHADKLGLAQLYQLRGRVGRGANRAYAYFLYHAGRKVTDTARERLSVIEQATELGAGFRIALKDLEIRGAGNLLGPEQSGHVASVGLDLYTRLLATAVEKARAERGRKTKDERRKAAGDDEQWTAEDEIAATPIPQSALHNPQLEEPPTVSLDLPLTAYLPEEYVPDDAVRLRMYQRMAASMSESQIRDLRRELEDRFGPLPEPTSNLLEVLRLKGLALAAGVESIRALAQELVVHTPQGEPIPEGLRMALQRKYRNIVKVSPHQVRIDRAKAGARWGEILAGVLEAMSE